MTSLSERFAALRPLIDAATQDALARLIAEIGAGPASADFTKAALASTRSGKRFRALLAHLGAWLSGAESLDAAPVAHLGAALELYQASALAHDDLIDHADTRRGAPTPHVRFEAAHRQADWSGSATDFGAAGAILVGDLLFSGAEREIIHQCEGLSPEKATRLMARYCDMHAEVALGQYLDVRAEHLPIDVEDAECMSIEDAMDVVLHKSAHYSIVHPAILGAIAQGAEDGIIDALDAILTPWGRAFQLRDDVLGVFGDSKATGKPAGDDLRQGKRTVLLALTWKNASVDERRVLASILGVADVAEDAIARAAAIIDERARAEHEELIDALVAEGHAALEVSPFDADQRAALAELAKIITERTA